MFSFSSRKTIVDLYPYIRRICDLTTPNMSTIFSGRSENRFNRAIPTLLCPWEGDDPVVEECSVCLTCDLADRGVRLVLSQPFRAETVLVGYWVQSIEMPEPWFFLGEVRRNQPIGGGYWSVGIELTEFANTDRQRAIAVLREPAAKLRTPVEVTA